MISRKPLHYSFGYVYLEAEIQDNSGTKTDRQLIELGIRPGHLKINRDIFKKNKEEKSLLKKMKRDWKSEQRVAA